VPARAYRVENVATPEGIIPGATGVTFAPDGRLYVCFRRGSIWSLETKTGEWRPFASGLFWPLGILAGEPGEFFVVQIPELTRVVDTDGDGRADLYETLSDRWGLSGNYHEFAYGPVRDADGSFFVALGCASSGGPVRPPLRGRPARHPRPLGAFGHHSPVSLRGWVVKITPEGETIPFAGGFRQPNGLARNLEGDLFVVDNQGDWVGTSPLYHVRKGTFHGHPSSLAWRDSFEGNPQQVTVDEIRQLRKPAAILFPQNDLAGSTSHPILETTAGKFGPYAGQLLIADWTHPRIYRAFLEKVDGEYQGACFPFLEGPPLRKGNERVAFSPDGHLYIAQCTKPWSGGTEGLQRVVWSGKVPMDILTMHLEPDGFRLVFTQPVEVASATAPSSYSLSHYYYASTAKYGSERLGQTSVPVRAVDVSDDGLTVRLRVDRLVAGRIYDLRPRGLRSRNGDELVTRLAAYTLNRLRRPPATKR